MKTKKMERENIYRTKDLYESACLYTLQQKLLGLEKEGTYFWFIYDDKQKCEKNSKFLLVR